MLTKAREMFGYNAVQTKDCKIMIELYGKTKTVFSLSDIHKLYAGVPEANFRAGAIFSRGHFFGRKGQIC